MSREAVLELWEGAPVEHWRQEWGIPQLLVFRETASTNDVMRTAAAQGAAAGTTAIADFQTGGRGRLGRSWLAPTGLGLLMSVLFRPAKGGLPEAAGTLPIRVGMAVARALRRSAGMQGRLKWPNDVLAGTSKVAGILCEASGDFVVVGIGVNVQQQADDFEPELRSHATSVQLATGYQAGRARIAGSILAELRPLLKAPFRPFDDADLEAFRALDALSGSRVAVDDQPAGVAAGIDPLGALLVYGPGGSRSFRAGTVRTLP